MNGIENLKILVREKIDVERITRDLAIELASAVADRDKAYKAELVKGGDYYFELMCGLKWIDLNKEPVDLGRESRYFFLSKKGIRAHRDLAYDGHYGGKE